MAALTISKSFIGSTKSKDLKQPDQHYRPEIDGLRAIAILAVIVNHFNADLLPSGFLGVDIFFVISGYVITKSLQRSRQQGPRTMLSNFYKRRIKRLFPALALCLIITSIAITIVNPEPLLSLRTGLTATIGASNIYLFKNSTNYFAQTSELNPFLHTWSLGVEEQFYLVYPIIFWICHNKNQSKNNALSFGYILLTLVALSLAAYFYVSSTNTDAAYFLMPFRFWEMAAGCLLCCNTSIFKPKGFSSIINEYITAAICASLIYLFFAPISTITTTTILTVTSTCLFIGFSQKSIRIKRVMSHQLLTYIGVISYSLYLWHWSVLSIARWSIGVTPQTTPALVAIICILSIGSFHFVEQPLRHKPWGHTSNKELMHGLVTIFITAVGLQAITRSSPGIYKITNSSNNREGAKGKPISWQNSSLETRDIIKTCHISDNQGLSRTTIDKCLLKESNSFSKQAFVIGDSHAANHFFGIRKGLTNYSTGLYTIGWGCGLVPEQAMRSIKKIDCQTYNALIWKFLSDNASTGDLVFVGMRWVHKKHLAKEIEEKLDELSRVLDAKKAKLILLDDVAELPDPHLCTERWYRPSSSNPLCTKSIEKVDSELVGLTLLGEKLAKSHKNFSFIRLRDVNCNNGYCSVYEGSEPLYIDQGHLTISASERNSDLFKQHIKKLSQ